ncbi:14497_t:CDS:2 [Funneliformis geosporum]|uniref:19512_t:CDS:1 n=1 Tax=Funneliformis geosporum TaxID=1117311 RepID=A0A9W4SWM1_9GLOM|nr:14497_t:CDS:2 [Funneliformis geosporum]CAI2183568.1 19512_t:CDS:2 [Funneliformis geosporum]
MAEINPIHYYTEGGDVILQVECTHFLVHKSFLSLASGFFKDFFTLATPNSIITINITNASKSSIPVIEVLEENVISIQDMLSFIYPNTILDINWKNVENLFRIADKFIIRKLTNSCDLFLQSNLIENVLTSFRLADQYRLPIPYKEASKIILDNFLKYETKDDFMQIPKRARERLGYGRFLYLNILEKFYLRLNNKGGKIRNLCVYPTPKPSFIYSEGNNVEIFKAHSIILGARSKYFNAAFFSEWTKKENDIIIFKKPNIKPQYSLNDINTNHIIDFLIATDELGLVELFEPIQRYVLYDQTKWAQENIIKIYNATVITELTMFQYYIKEIIDSQPELIFESNDFISVKERLLISVIEKDELALEETEIFNYVIKWGMGQKPSINTDLSELTQEDYVKLKVRLSEVIQYIRFFSLTSDEFYEMIWPFRKVLSDDLIDKLVEYNLCTNDDISSQFDSLPKRVSRFGSNIISLIRANIILNWIDHDQSGISYDYKLLLRGSRDGMDMNTFFRLCSNESSIVVVIKLKDSMKIIGGYNPTSWSSCAYNWIPTDESFIFSFDNAKLNCNILSRVENEDCAIKNFLDVIGFGDLQFLPSGSYDHKYYKNRIIHKDLFIIEDYEVFKIIPKE